jgi:hypothetical protein
VPKPSSEIEKFWTRASDMLAAPSAIGRGWFPCGVSIEVSRSSGSLKVSVERW